MVAETLRILPRTRARRAGDTRVYIEDFDAVATALGKNLNGVPHLDIDLTATRYLHHAVLPFLVGAVSERHKLGLGTNLLLPDDLSLVRYLNSWDLATSLEHIGLERVLDPDSMSIWNKYAGFRTDSDWVFRGSQRNKISLAPFRMARIPDISVERWASAANSGKDRWLHPDLTAVFSSYLNGSGDDIGATVAYELAKNAAMHSGTPDGGDERLAFMSGQFIRPAKDAPSDAFVMCVWDNCNSVLSTLDAVVRSGRSVTSPRTAQIRYPLHVTDSRGVYHEVSPSALRDVDQSDGLGHLNEDVLLATAFLDGVSSRPDKDTADKDSSLPGSGLWHILECVVFYYSGTLRYLGADFRLEVKFDKRLVGPHVTVKRNPQVLRIKGNLMIAEVPVVPLPEGQR